MKKLVLTIALASILAGCDNSAKEHELAMRRAEQQRQQEMQERKRERDEQEAKAKREKEEAERKEAERIRKRREQALKIIGHEVAADKEIVKQYQNEVLAIEENKSDFLRRLNAIKIPDVEITTNIVSINQGKTKKVIKKVKLSEHQKSVRKLMRLYEDGAICTMYESCTDRSAKKLLDELECEWRTEEDDYNNVTKALREVDANEARARKKLTEQLQDKRNARINNNGRRMASLKKRRAEVMKKISYHESRKCSISHFSGQKCKCTITEWRSAVQSLNDEINSLQSEMSAEKSTAVGLDEGNQLAEISSKASRKRAEINQDFTHQSAVLKEIADKYQRLLVEDLLDGMAKRREYLLSEIDQIVKRNDLKIKYIDDRSELSPEMATSFIDSDNQKTMAGLHLVNKEQEEQRREKENERLLNTIKALNTVNINADINETSERRTRRRRRRTNAD